MRKLVAAVALATVPLTFVLASSALADNDGRGKFKASLNGYEEVVGGPGPASTGSVSTVASGTFEARVEDGKIRYKLSYRNMEGGTVSQAHLHFAQRHVGGGVIVFLCGPPPASDKVCPTPGGTVEGEIEANDIIGPVDQGIEAGNLAELLRAMRAGAVYANVHSTPRFPEGEIRGQVRRGKGRGQKD